jgi:hypothetical protein
MDPSKHMTGFASNQNQNQYRIWIALNLITIHNNKIVIEIYFLIR